MITNGNKKQQAQMEHKPKLARLECSLWTQYMKMTYSGSSDVAIRSNRAGYRGLFTKHFEFTSMQKGDVVAAASLLKEQGDVSSLMLR